MGLQNMGVLKEDISPGCHDIKIGIIYDKVYRHICYFYVKNVLQRIVFLLTWVRRLLTNTRENELCHSRKVGME